MARQKTTPEDNEKGRAIEEEVNTHLKLGGRSFQWNNEDGENHGIDFTIFNDDGQEIGHIEVELLDPPRLWLAQKWGFTFLKAKVDKYAHSMKPITYSLICNGWAYSMKMDTILRLGVPKTIETRLGPTKIYQVDPKRITIAKLFTKK